MEVKTGRLSELAELGAPSLAGLFPLPGLAGLDEEVPLDTVTVSGIFPSAKEGPQTADAPDVTFPAAPLPDLEGLPFMGIAAMEEFMAIGGMEELGESAVVRACVQSLHKASCGGQNGKKSVQQQVKKSRKRAD
jgi:hypothetical protein